MQPIERNIIFHKLRLIKGAQICKIGRAINIVWINFHGIDGKKYALHLQTFFRLCNKNNVLITDYDKYLPTDKLSSTPLFELKTFNYDVQGDNLFDEWVKHQGEILLYNSVVDKVEVNTYGDLTIYFSNNLTLSIFLDTSGDDECWRIFELPSGEKHFVVTGNKIENLEDWIDEAN